MTNTGCCAAATERSKERNSSFTSDVTVPGEDGYCRYERQDGDCCDDGCYSADHLGDRKNGPTAITAKMTMITHVCAFVTLPPLVPAVC